MQVQIALLVLFLYFTFQRSELPCPKTYGGMDPLKTEGGDSLSDIQELDQDTWEWRRLDEGLAETRGISSLGSAVVMVDQVCP